MRRLLPFILLCLPWPGAAADVILKRSGEQIEVIVEEISDAEVRYKKTDNPEGAAYVIPRGEVFSITYGNGSRDVFAGGSTPPAADDGYPWPPVSRAYAPGELFDEGGVRGMVIHVADGGRHGLVMSLDQERLAWGTVSDNPFKDKFTSGATDEADGWKNMLVMRDLVENSELSWLNVPAFAWCREHGPGWYLPARAELEHIWAFGVANPAYTWKEFKSAVENLNAKLLQCGGDEFPTNLLHWSSTEKDEGGAYYFTFINEPFKGYTKGTTKYSLMRVRAVHKF